MGKNSIYNKCLWLPSLKNPLEIKVIARKERASFANSELKQFTDINGLLTTSFILHVKVRKKLESIVVNSIQAFNDCRTLAFEKDAHHYPNQAQQIPIFRATRINETKIAH